MELDSVQTTIAALQDGRMVIIVDDDDRENEGDFVVAAEHSTLEAVNFMATYGKGLICVALPPERCQELELGPMVSHNTSLHSTNFTVSVDLIGNACTTGISAHDRSKTLQALASPNAKPANFARPGHIFPLREADKGLDARRGHTEAALQLMRWAGLRPAATICEIISEDGSMARLPQLRVLAKRHNLKITSVEHIARHLAATRDYIRTSSEAVALPTDYGDFKIQAFRDNENKEHAALLLGTWSPEDEVLVRVHSSCLTGDVFHSQRCECGPQLHEAMRRVQQKGQGIILYLDQEGRGIGLVNKLRAYGLQEKGRDTVQANLDLGFEADQRAYNVSAAILHTLGVRRVALLTNNPLKAKALSEWGLEVSSMIPLVIPSNEHNKNYLEVKKSKLGHRL